MLPFLGLPGAWRPARVRSKLGRQGATSEGGEMATTLHLGDHGPDVKTLQAEVDQQLKDREFPWRTVRTDGRFGDKTQTACHFTGWILGFSPSQLTKIQDEGTITPHAYSILVHEKARSDAMKKRERERRHTVKKLKFLHAHP